MPKTSSSGSAELPLIQAAIELFGRDGYASVSTRALCEHANTNVSSIKYHFGSKDALYRAAVEHVINQLRPQIEGALNSFEQMRDVAAGNRNTQALLIRTLIDRLMHFFLGNEDIPHYMPFVMREFFSPGPHFELFYEALPRRIHEMFTNIVAMAFDLNPEDESTIVQAHALLGQVMIFHIARPILFARTGWQAYDAERIKLVSDIAQTMVLRSLALDDANG
jgi:TetR/AcrR family transcriptional regulator, regulator of cefoperazone and chloramphenicol sensitivity